MTTEQQAEYARGSHSDWTHVKAALFILGVTAVALLWVTVR